MTGRRLDLSQVVYFASQYLVSFLSQNSDDVVWDDSVSVARWLPPLLEYVKLNFDGACFWEGQELGVGVCARGASGECLAWLAKRVDRMGNCELVEALAARDVVLLALHKRWRSIIVEGDCATLIPKILSPGDDYSVVGPISLDIRSLSSRFHACVFQFVKRSCNTIAHALAKPACGFCR
ncbi:UNVERIFIED_CONTAM: hypothetical protein Sradi_3647200 [Sesamum radiatum]|uniref:RNase H type-1 domain-containing protein n=1 Tax=Sesamum radiatum TaxID=300843 RepID=A0AAW2QIT4_SESRA